MTSATRSRAVMALALGAMACVLAMATLGWAVTQTAAGERADGRLLTDVAGQQGPVLDALASISSDLTATVAVACAVAALVVALARRRVRLVIGIAILIAGSHLATQMLKHLAFERAHLVEGLAITPNSYPSGHTALTVACVSALLLAAPARFSRWMAIPGAAWSTAVGVGVVAASWHRPSDVVGAALVVGALLCALGAVSAVMRRASPLTPPVAWPVTMALAVAVVAAVAAPTAPVALTSLAVAGAMAAVSWLAASLDL